MGFIVLLNVRRRFVDKHLNIRDIVGDNGSGRIVEGHLQTSGTKVQGVASYLLILEITDNLRVGNGGTGIAAEQGENQKQENQRHCGRQKQAFPSVFIIQAVSLSFRESQRYFS